MANICSACGQRQNTPKQPDEGTTWWAGKCDFCNEQTYCCDTRDYGMEEDKVVEDLKNLFNIK